MKSVFRKFASYWPFPVIASLKNGRKMYVDLRSQIGQGLYVKGEFDPAVFVPIQAALTPGSVFLDIGANVGFYSLMALDEVGPKGVVHAFEIDPRPLRCLERTAKRFAIDNLKVHAVAVSNQDGVAVLAQESDCGNSYVSTNASGRRVETTSIDSWVARQSPPSIDAIKIDVEGSELLVLQGAKETLRRHRPVIVFEAYDALLRRSGGSLQRTRDLLQELEYQIVEVPDCWSPTLVATPSSTSSPEGSRCGPRPS